MTDGEKYLHQWVAGLLPENPELGEQFATLIASAPDRISRAYQELFRGYRMTVEEIVKPTVRLDPSVPHPGVVVVRETPFFSYCGHHFLPFFGTVDLAYVPGTMIVGLGKLPRLVDMRACRLQIQELLARDLLDDLMNAVGARGAFVRVTARHLCICARGPAKSSASVVTTYTAGTLADLHSLPEIDR